MIPVPGRLRIGMGLAVWLGVQAGVAVAGISPLETLAVPGLPTAATADGVRWQAQWSQELTQPLFDVAGIERNAGRGWAGRLEAATGPWSFGVGAQDRRLHDKAQAHAVQSWHATAQVEWTTPDQPHRWGLRLGAWGSQADHLLQSTSSALRVSGLKGRLIEMELVRPRDLQWQLDLLARSRLADPRWAVSGYAGLGASAVSRSVVSGKATISGCTYQLDFGDQRLNAKPLPGCPNGWLVSVPNRLLAVDVQQETRYRSLHGHLGGALHWAAMPWRLAVGGELQQWLRQGQEVRHVRNLVLAGEAAHTVSPGLALVLRGQYQHRQLLGDVPMLYNSRSASSTRRVLSVTAGMQVEF